MYVTWLRSKAASNRGRPGPSPNRHNRFLPEAKSLLCGKEPKARSTLMRHRAGPKVLLEDSFGLHSLLKRWSGPNSCFPNKIAALALACPASKAKSSLLWKEEVFQPGTPLNTRLCSPHQTSSSESPGNVKEHLHGLRPHLG